MYRFGGAAMVLSQVAIDDGKLSFPGVYTSSMYALVFFAYLGIRWSGKRAVSSSSTLAPQRRFVCVCVCVCVFCV